VSALGRILSAMGMAFLIALAAAVGCKLGEPTAEYISKEAKRARDSYNAKRNPSGDVVDSEFVS
jgi:hypothetical protein